MDLIRKPFQMADELIQSLVDALFQDPGIKAFCERKQLTKKQLIAELLEYQCNASVGTKKAPPKERFEITLEYAKSMYSSTSDTGFIGDGLHCVHCYGNCTTVNHPPHTYCSVECGTIYCKDHLKKDRETEIKAYNSGKFDLNTHKEKRDVTRVNAAKSYLKEHGYNTKELKTMATKSPLEVVVYKHNKDYLYDKKSGVVLMKIEDDCKREFRTVGVDRQCNQNIRKLGPSSIMELKDTRVTFRYESLNSDAKKMLDLD